MTQKEALHLLKLGHNVFLTGPAGSGKTYLLNQYIAYLRKHKVPVGITASTGIASTHMGGTTIHSWVGMGISDALSEKEIRELFKRQYLRVRLKKTKVLIIDEISMLHAHRLDLVDMICRAFKENNLPFGGMQVILCGDFFQLPPVTKPKDPTIYNRHSREGGNPQTNWIPDPFGFAQDRQVRDDAQGEKADSLSAQFVTNSLVWKTMNLKVCYLEEQYRQDDRALLRVLNDIRNNEVSEMTVEYLNERMKKDTIGYAKPTRLFTHNTDVDKINLEHLEALKGDAHEYLMNWRGNFGLTETLKKSCLAPQTLVLKKGAQVMFVKNNYEAGYVNGTIGEIIDFVPDPQDALEVLPIVRTYEGAEIAVTRAEWSVKEPDLEGERELAAISQFPLRLAWAITVHKSQGMSLDAAEIDLSRSFVPGMGYVALSRVRSLSGLKLLGLNQMALQINPDVSEMDQGFLEKSQEAVQYILGIDDENKQKMQSQYLQYLQE